MNGTHLMVCIVVMLAIITTVTVYESTIIDDMWTTDEERMEEGLQRLRSATDRLRELNR